MKTPKVIVVIGFYTGAPNVYRPEDVVVHIPFKSEAAIDQYKRQRELRLRLDSKEVETIDGVRVSIYHIERLPEFTRKKYLEGISQEDLQNTEVVYDRILANQSKRDDQKKKKEGYVNYKYPVSREETKGSLTFMLTPRVLKYIENPKTVWGYLGHENRKHHMDEYIEYTIMRVLDYGNKKGLKIGLVDMVAEWMCSSGARHWTDMVGESNKTEFKRHFKDIIVEQMLANRDKLSITEEDIKGIQRFLG